MDRMTERPPLALGQLLATPGALRRLEDAGVMAWELLLRHEAGDWGDLDAEDHHANDRAVQHGERVLSAYQTAAGVGDHRVGPERDHAAAAGGVLRDGAGAGAAPALSANRRPSPSNGCHRRHGATPRRTAPIGRQAAAAPPLTPHLTPARAAPPPFLLYHSPLMVRGSGGPHKVMAHAPFKTGRGRARTKPPAAAKDWRRSGPSVENGHATMRLGAEADRVRCDEVLLTARLRYSFRYSLRYSF